MAGLQNCLEDSRLFSLSQQETCYHASPMLWWGVMTVTGVGWFLFGQILLVVLFIAIGGSAILVSPSPA
jgi:hypothetical protein